jgi:hypothetical protein
MARPMTPEATELRRQVVVAVQAEIDQGRQPDRLSIARRFRGRAPATTLLRWVDGAVARSTTIRRQRVLGVRRRNPLR